MSIVRAGIPDRDCKPSPKRSRSSQRHRERIGCAVDDFTKVTSNDRVGCGFVVNGQCRRWNVFCRRRNKDNRRARQGQQRPRRTFTQRPRQGSSGISSRANLPCCAILDDVANHISVNHASSGKGLIATLGSAKRDCPCASSGRGHFSAIDESDHLLCLTRCG